MESTTHGKLQEEAITQGVWSSFMGLAAGTSACDTCLRRKASSEITPGTHAFGSSGSHQLVHEAPQKSFTSNEEDVQL